MHSVEDKEINTRASHSNISNSKETTCHLHQLEKLNYKPDEGDQESPEDDVKMTLNTSRNFLPPKENKNDHSAQHVDADKEEGCLGNLMDRVSATLGANSIPVRYKPVSVRSGNHQHQNENQHQHQPLLQQPLQHNNGGSKRSRSTPTANVIRQHSLPSDSPKPPFGMRRRPSITPRRQSEFGSRPPQSQPPSRTTPEGRQSFELKQNALYSMQTDGTLEHMSAMENMKVEEQWNSQQNFWRRLAIRASAPDTSQKELIQRSTFLVISSMTVGAGVLWGLMYVALEEWLAAIMPFLYSTFMSLVLFTCICRNGNSGRGYDIFVRCQLSLILMLPFAVHEALGGVEKSGGVMLWSFLCPMGAAFFRNANESVRWFWLYLGISGLLLVKGFWDVDEVDKGLILLDGNVTFVEGPGIVDASSHETVQKLYFLMNILGVKCIIFSAVFLFARELEKEYTKSEEVLLNILPASIVKRIKRGEFPIVDHVAGVTILFADLVGFTKASTELHPNFLIGLFLRDIFHAFDELSSKHGLEKIKTIGDAYMVVGGLNHGEELSSHSKSQGAEYSRQEPYATNTMMLAADMLRALDKVNKKYNLHFDLRIGVHTGPVVAGVLGLKRFTYDVWGDSVNTASRMESNGVPGMIHLSSDMHQSVGDMTDIFEYSCCGPLDIKGKGQMTTYLAKPLMEAERRLSKGEEL